jgi:uncharacterized membrane protein
MSFLLAFAIGVVAGLRSLTAPAIAAWAAHLGWIDLSSTPLAWLGSAAAAYILLACMLAELVADKLPQTPNRTALGPFLGRVLLGGLAGAAVTAGAGRSLALGAVLGGLGGIVGTFGGFKARTGLVRALKVPDYVAAILEDIVAVGGAIVIVRVVS